MQWVVMHMCNLIFWQTIDCCYTIYFTYKDPSTIFNCEILFERWYLKKRYYCCLSESEDGRRSPGRMNGVRNVLKVSELNLECERTDIQWELAWNIIYEVLGDGDVESMEKERGKLRYIVKECTKLYVTLGVRAGNKERWGSCGVNTLVC